MHLLISCDDPKLLTLLLDAGARTDIWSRDRKTPLSLAQEFHRDASAKLLTEYNDSKFDYIISNVLPKVQFPALSAIAVTTPTLTTHGRILRFLAPPANSSS